LALRALKVCKGFKEKLAHKVLLGRRAFRDFKD
jgi:hypothetical protein